MIIMCAWAFCACSSAWLRSRRTVSSSSREDRALELARRDVDLDVELRELGLEVVVGDQLEHVRVRQRRVTGLLGEVELDLQPDRAPVRIEARFGQHPGEDVQAELDLVPVGLAILAAEGGVSDFVAHGSSFPRGTCSVSCRCAKMRRSGRTRPRAATADLRGLRGDGLAAGAGRGPDVARRAARRRARRRRAGVDGPPVRRAPRGRAGRVRRARVVGQLRVGRARDRPRAGLSRRDDHRPGLTLPGDDAASTCSSPPRTGGTTSASPERRCGSSGRTRTASQRRTVDASTRSTSSPSAGTATGCDPTGARARKRTSRRRS